VLKVSLMMNRFKPYFVNQKDKFQRTRSRYFNGLLNMNTDVPVETSSCARIVIAGKGSLLISLIFNNQIAMF
jgi:hypothetical protein